MTWIIMQLFGLRSLVGRAWGWITGSALHLALAGCAALALWGAYERHEAGKWHKVADQRGNALKAIPAAQAAALAAQLAVNAKQTADLTQHAKEADNAKNDALAAADAAYGLAHRVRVCTNTGGTSPASTTAQADPAALGNGPGADAIMVQAGDYRTLTENTERLARVKAWGDGLVKDGLAEVVK